MLKCYNMNKKNICKKAFLDLNTFKSTFKTI